MEQTSERRHCGAHKVCRVGELGNAVQLGGKHVHSQAGCQIVHVTPQRVLGAYF
jgi:hypothetical protein